MLARWVDRHCETIIALMLAAILMGTVAALACGVAAYL